MTQTLADRLGLRLPIIQAPMAGTSTPALAAAVTNAGGLGSLGLGAASVAAAARMVRDTMALTMGAINLNFFCHAPPQRDPMREAGWIQRAAPLFAQFGAEPPPALNAIYASLRDNEDMLRMIVQMRPAMVSFHFGLPHLDQIAALKAEGILLAASATSLAEARQIQQAGLDAVVAQGWSAGGHRGIFDPDAADERLTTEALTRQLVQQIGLPVIAAGGLMDGADIHRALGWGAVAAQLGTAFIGCPESAADAPYRQRLAEAPDTVMTRVISGRPARALENLLTRWGADARNDQIAAYPCAYDLGKTLNAAARAAGVSGYGAEWAGAEAARARPMPAADLMALLAKELRRAADGE